MGLVDAYGFEGQGKARPEGTVWFSNLLFSLGNASFDDIVLGSWNWIAVVTVSTYLLSYF